MKKSAESLGAEGGCSVTWWGYGGVGHDKVEVINSTLRLIGD